MGFEAFLLKSLVSLFDLQSIITIIAGYTIKSPKHIYFWAIVAGFIGFGVSLALGGEEGEAALYSKLLAQIVLGILIVVSRKKRGAFDKTEAVIDTQAMLQEAQISAVPSDALDTEEVDNIDLEKNSIKNETPAGIDLFFADAKRLISFSLPWSERTTLEKAYTAMVAVILIGLLPMPYEFYDNLRVVVCLCLYFYFQAILPERKQRRGWFVAIIGLLILYNPVAPIHTGDQAAWTLINAGVIYTLYKARAIFDTAKSKETPEKSDPDSYMNTEQSVDQ